MFNRGSHPGLITSKDVPSFWMASFFYNRMKANEVVRFSEVDIYSTKPIDGGMHYTQGERSYTQGEIGKEQAIDGYDETINETFSRPKDVDFDVLMDSIIPAVAKIFELENDSVIRLAGCFEIIDKLYCECDIRTYSGREAVKTITIKAYSPLIKSKFDLNKIVLDGFDIKDQPLKSSFNVEIAYHNGRDWDTTDVPLQSEPIEGYLNENYNDDVVTETKRILSIINEKKFFGKTILIYGEPGTGKSFWIRGISKTIAEKYTISIIPSWKEFFGSVSGYYYMISGNKKPILFIFEDSGEIFVKGEKYGTFESILLNLTDGLITSGREDIFLFSFNQRIEKLNDALVRPGRCLSAIYCGLLSVEKSNAFLKKHSSNVTVDEPKTLGELYAIAYGLKDKIADEAKKTIGFLTKE